MSKPHFFSKKDLKAIAVHIQGESGKMYQMRYTACLRAAEKLDLLRAQGVLDMCWSFKSGELRNRNGSLTPYEAFKWVDFLGKLNEAWTAPGKWVLLNSGPSVNQLWLVEEGSSSEGPLAVACVVTEFQQMFEAEDREDPFDLIPLDDVWVVKRFGAFVSIAVGFEQGGEKGAKLLVDGKFCVHSFFRVDANSDDPQGLSSIAELASRVTLSE